MPNFLTSLVLFTGLSFLCYGFSCLYSAHMRSEFIRFGLEKFRWLTGILQLAGAAGMLAGLFHPFWGGAAAAGLSLLMLLGFGLRIKINDGLVKALPALAYFLLTLYLSVALFSG